MNNCKVFISYSHHDYYDSENNVIKGSSIDIIRQTLGENGISYWIDENVSPGDPFSKNIGVAISSCSVFLFISSVRSNASEWAQGEIHTAKSLNKRIIPIKIDDCAYNDSYAIYLSHLDFIDYSQKSPKALSRLIHTIKDERINVFLPQLVSIGEVDKDISIGDAKLSDKILQIFSAVDITGAIKNYIDVVNELSNIYDKATDNQRKVLRRFSDIADLTNYNVQTQKLIALSTEIQQYVESEQRTNRFLLQLGAMMIYFWLNEIKTLIKIQKEIRDSTFDLTWWEKYGDDVKAFGGALLGLGLAIVAKTNVGQGTVVGARSGQQMSKEHKEKLNKNRKYFEALKAVISALKFSESK